MPTQFALTAVYADGARLDFQEPELHAGNFEAVVEMCLNQDVAVLPTIVAVVVSPSNHILKVAGRVPCLCCHGKGVQHVTVVEVGAESGVSGFDMPCSWCNGTGTMTAPQAVRYEELLHAWCECLEPTRQWYDNGKGSHGVVCGDCGKLLQVG
jgi:hypothetical protein